MNQKDAAQAKLDINRAYRALFLQEDGTLKPEADMVLRDLEKLCGWMPKAMPTIADGSIDPLRIAGDVEKRRVFAHIKTRLFEELTTLKRATEINLD